MTKTCSKENDKLHTNVRKHKQYKTCLSSYGVKTVNETECAASQGYNNT